MTVLAPSGRRPDQAKAPPPPREREDVEALIEEARQRARKRRRRHGGALATGVLAGIGLYAAFGGHTHSHPGAAPRPRAAAGVALTRTCRTSQLKITTIHSFAGLGHSGGHIAFTNESRTACVLTGWPKLMTVTAAGRSSAAVDYPASSFEVTHTG